MLHNHPSLLLWVGGNELFPEKRSPPPDIAKTLPNLLSALDPNRFYIASSMSNYTNYDPSFALAPKDGPYGYLDLKRFDERNPGLKFWNGTSASGLILGFQPEIGSSSTPVFNTVAKFVEDLVNFRPLIAKLSQKYLTSINICLITMTWVGTIYTATGTGSMSEYCLFAQMAQYCQVKGIFEAFKDTCSLTTLLCCFGHHSHGQAFRAYVRQLS